MSGVNMKLMKGIEEAENQMQKEKTTQKPEEKKKVENELQNTQKAVRKPQTAKGQQKVKNTVMRKKLEMSQIRYKRSRCFHSGHLLKI